MLKSGSLGCLLTAALVFFMLPGATAQGQSSSKGPVFLNVDHASVCGSNLDTMRQAFASAGLATDYGGPHATGGTHMALLGFSDGSYLELIAPQDAKGAEGSGWAQLMAGNAGPCAWAVEPADIQQEVARLKAAGIAVEGPTPGSRKRPDGMFVEWQTAKVGPSAPGSTLPFLIQDRTPRAWRVQPSASLQNSGLTGIEVVVLGVNNLNSSIALFRRAYNWAEPLVEEHKSFEATLAYFPGEPVILASPLGGRSWLSERLQKFGETPAALLLATQNVGSAAKKFHLNQEKEDWFGQKIAWFGQKKLNGIKLGVIGNQ